MVLSLLSQCKAVHTFHGASASGGRLVHHSTLHVGQRWGWLVISGRLSGLPQTHMVFEIPIYTVPRRSEA